MRRKGRYVLECAVLIPGICLLLVYMVYFTFYVHDYAVCAHTVLEVGIKGTYPDGRSNLQIEQELEQELQQKLEERLLWMRDKETEVQVNPVQLKICVSGSGGFLPVEAINVEKKLYRIHPCETIRRSRWMKD